MILGLDASSWELYTWNMKTPRIAKSKHVHALITLAACAEMGEVTAEQVFERMTSEGRRAAHCTIVRMWDLQALGLLAGHGQHPTYARGVAHTYTVTDLGRVLLAWS